MRHSIADEIRAHVERRSPIPLRLAFQDDLLPHRDKPWGTAHALVAAAPLLEGRAFAVANADDYYDRDGIARLAYDGTGLPVQPDDLQRAQITTRDIDRGEFPHYLLKEISEAPGSFRKTLRGKLVERDGRIVGRYRKIHLPGHADHKPGAPFQHLEKKFFEVGDLGFRAFDTDGVRMGMCLCNMYGCNEASGIISSTNNDPSRPQLPLADNWKFGRVGRCVPGCEVRLVVDAQQPASECAARVKAREVLVAEAAPLEQVRGAFDQEVEHPGPPRFVLHDQPSAVLRERVVQQGRQVDRAGESRRHGGIIIIEPRLTGRICAQGRRCVNKQELREVIVRCDHAGQVGTCATPGSRMAGRSSLRGSRRGQRDPDRRCRGAGCEGGGARERRMSRHPSGTISRGSPRGRGRLRRGPRRA